MQNKLTWFKRLYRLPDIIIEGYGYRTNRKNEIYPVYSEDEIPQYRWRYCAVMNIIDLRCWPLINKLFRGRRYEYPFGLCYLIGEKF